MAEHITVKNEASGGALAGPLWAMGWLFTIGFLKMTLAQNIFAILIWPFYLGRFFHRG